jgi:hypothetical protein
MMKMLFLFFCVFSLMAQDSDSLSYKTIDINGFATDDAKTAEPQVSEPEFDVNAEAAKLDLEEKMEQIPAEVAMPEPAPAPEVAPIEVAPRLTKLERQKQLRSKMQNYNNLLLKEGIERERLQIESELGNKVKKLNLTL